MASEQTRRLPRRAAGSSPYSLCNWPVFLVNEHTYTLATS